MTWFFLIVFAAYFLWMFLLIIGWQFALEYKPQPSRTNNFFITVIVPFRNEEETIRGVVEDLMRQNYPPELYEILLINDHSEDKSAAILKNIEIDYHNLFVYDLSNEAVGKKSAIAFGIEKANGEIIATVDADCDIPPSWLSRLTAPFNDEEIKFVFGAVRILGTGNFFGRLQEIEFCGLMGSAGAMAAIGLPIMCNGANLAYRKGVFREVDGFEGNEHIPSGDDEFLMRKVIKTFRGGVTFLADKDATISTRAKLSLNAFIQQRLRWAGKWKSNVINASKLLAVFVWFFQAVFVLLLIGGIGGWIGHNLIIPLIGGKILLDYIFLMMVCEFLRINLRLMDFFVLLVVYPWYVLFTGLFSLGKGYTWKGRQTAP